jgi:hypothetical protein
MANAGAFSSAAEISPVALEKGRTAIFLIGEIKPDDATTFRALAQKYDDALVLLESDGGSVGAAIEIGKAIRLKGYSTAVINGSSCNSSCALIWLAGSPRALSKSAKIGFHAAYADVDGQARESGFANAMIGRYLTLLNLPDQAVFFATTSPPNSLNWLTASNYRSSGIDATIIKDFQFSSDDTYQAHNKRPESELWRKSGNWSIYVDHTLEDSCFIIGSFTNNTVFRVGINQKDPGNYYLMIGNSDWASLSEGRDYKLEFKFGQQTPWDVPTKAVRIGDSTDLLATFRDTTFWKEFIAAPYLSVTREGRFVTQIEMKGTKPAFDTMIECQKAANVSRKTRDPFAE